MSAAKVSSTAGSPKDAPSARPELRIFPRTPVGVVIVTATLLALGLRVYQITRPGVLLGVAWYDDGVYFASALRLAQGALPYRDFVFAQPPGLTLLLTPAALAAKVIGTARGMAIARILTLLASTAGVVLGGLLVRHRGLLAVTVTCGLLAVFPASVGDARTVFIEPWVALFCLAGALVVFDGDRLAGQAEQRGPRLDEDRAGVPHAGGEDRQQPAGHGHRQQPAVAYQQAAQHHGGRADQEGQDPGDGHAPGGADHLGRQRGRSQQQRESRRLREHEVAVRQCALHQAQRAGEIHSVVVPGDAEQHAGPGDLVDPQA